MKHASVFDYFKATGEFTDARDENELPTTLSGGGEVPKARAKKLLKEKDAFVKKRDKLLKTIADEGLGGSEAYLAKLEADLEATQKECQELTEKLVALKIAAGASTTGK